jgi:hypothetical protein
MDPTAAWEEIREILLNHREGRPVELDRLVELWAGVDQWLTTGGHMPEQWTSPEEDDRPVRSLGIRVTDPDITLADIRSECLYPDLRKLVRLIAGLDWWITSEGNGLPEHWLQHR